MYRRVVTVLLVPCLLLTQSAAFGHCHGGNQPAGHALNAHVHAAQILTPHGHHHGPGGHHQHDDEPEPPAVPPIPEPPPDHDDDALYVSADAVVGRVQSGDEPSRSWVWGLSLAGVLTAWAAGYRDDSLHRPQPPPRSASPDCPLYVRHLALLI